MSRKWVVLGTSMVSFALLSAGLSLASDDEKGKALEKIMEKVNKTNLALKKSTRTLPAFKKADNGKDVAKDAEELVKLGKEARAIKDAAKKAKDLPNAIATWDELMDGFITSSESLAKAAHKGDFEASKDAYKTLTTRCTTCHEKFRVDDEGK
jgi:cytochrome c556